MSKFTNYIQSAYDELVHKVTWPSWEELQQSTVLVLVALLLLTLLIFVMDGGCEFVLETFYKMFS